jgi:hypothetical protein
MDPMYSLKVCVKQYRDLDNELIELNRKIYEKRDERRRIEAQLTDLMKLEEFSEVNNFDINDGTVISIKKPGTYSKSWGLSKKDLKEYLMDALDGATAVEVYEYILKKHQQKLVATDYDFVRITSK